MSIAPPVCANVGLSVPGLFIIPARTYRTLRERAAKQINKATAEVLAKPRTQPFRRKYSPRLS